MPVKTTTSGLLGKLKKAHQEHKDDPFNQGGGGDCPAGIDGGVAALAECGVGFFKDDVATVSLRGKPFFYAVGVIESPDTVEEPQPRGLGKTGKPEGAVKYVTKRCKGLQTRIMEALCETPDRSRKTLEEHWAWVQNAVKGLKGDGEFDVEDVLQIQGEKIVGAGPLLQQLVDAGVKFRFRTWRGDPTPQFQNPRTQHAWQGSISEEEAPAAEEGDGTVDETAGKAEAPWEDDDKAEAQNDEAPAEDSGEDLDTLLEQANSDDQDTAAAAQEALKAQAEAVGVNSDDLNTWEEVVEAIKAAQGGEEGTEASDEAEAEQEPEAEAEWAPQKDEVYLIAVKDKAGKPVFKIDPKTKKPLLDKKTKKPVQKTVEATVIFVNEKKRVVNLLNADDQKTRYLNVSWDDLIQQ